MPESIALIVMAVSTEVLTIALTIAAIYVSLLFIKRWDSREEEALKKEAMGEGEDKPPSTNRRHRGLRGYFRRSHLESSLDGNTSAAEA